MLALLAEAEAFRAAYWAVRESARVYLEQAQRTGQFDWPGFQAELSLIQTPNNTRMGIERYHFNHFAKRNLRDRQKQSFSRQKAKGVLAGTARPEAASGPPRPEGRPPSGTPAQPQRLPQPQPYHQTLDLDPAMRQAIAQSLAEPLPGTAPGQNPTLPVGLTLAAAAHAAGAPLEEFSAQVREDPDLGRMLGVAEAELEALLGPGPGPSAATPAEKL